MTCRSAPAQPAGARQKGEGPPMTFLLEVLAEALLSEIATTIVAILLA
jgi:hypothetical protein